MIKFCCYHCGDYVPNPKTRQQCKQDKPVCLSAYMSSVHSEPKYREKCYRDEGQCVSRFHTEEAKDAHSCFVGKGGG